MRMRNTNKKYGDGRTIAEQEWWQNTEWPTTLAALISSRDMIHLRLYFPLDKKEKFPATFLILI
jgi:hypothetical protein